MCMSLYLSSETDLLGSNMSALVLEVPWVEVLEIPCFDRGTMG